MGRRIGQIGAVLAVCAGVRVWMMARAEVIARDGTLYVRMAREWSADPAKAVNEFEHHVGYPAAISAVHDVLTAMGQPPGRAGWERAGQVVSLAFALAATVALWLFAGWVFNWQAAWIAAVLFSVGPKWSALGADVLSDAPAVCLQMWGVVAAVAAGKLLAHRSGWALALAAAVGVCAGAGYLVRGEALLVAVVAAAFWLAFHFRPGEARALTAAAVAVMALAAIACALPYMLAIGDVTKKPIFLFAAHAQPTALAAVLAPDLAGTYGAPRQLVNQTFEAMGPPLAAIVCAWLGAWGVRRIARPWWLPLTAPRREGIFLMVAAGVCLTPLAILRYRQAQFLSHRYLMFPAMLWAPLVGAALLDAGKIAAALSARSRRALSAKPVTFLLTGAVLAGMLAYLLPRPLHRGKGYYRQAARLLARCVEDDKTLVTDSSWILHYAEKDGLAVDGDWLKHGSDPLRRRAAIPRPDWLVLSDRTLLEADAVLADEFRPPRFLEVAAFVQETARRPDTIRVYHRLGRLLSNCPPGGRADLAHPDALTRDEMMVVFGGAEESRRRIQGRIYASLLFLRLRGAEPDRAEWLAAVKRLEDGHSPGELAARLLAAPGRAEPDRPASPYTRGSYPFLFEALLYRRPAGKLRALPRLSGPALAAAVDALLATDEFRTCVLPVLRLNLVYAGPWPDRRLLAECVAKRRSGTPLPAVATLLAAEAEFRRRHGDIVRQPDKQKFVRWLYQTTLGRDADSEGLAYWTAKLP